MTDNISEIKQRISLEFLVNRFGLEVKGGYIKSIFKLDDNSPSMRLYFDSNTYKDYSTGEQGDQIDFYCAYNRCDKSTAIAELCDLAGIDRTNKPQTNAAPVIRKKAFKDFLDNSVLESMNEIEQYNYQERLGLMWDVENDALIEESEAFISKIRESEAIALKDIQISRVKKNVEIFEHLYSYCSEKGFDENIYKYLTETRKLSENIIKKFKLFSIKNYNEVNNHLKKAFLLWDLQRSGLFNAKGNLIFFAHRLMIPYLWNDKIVYLRGRFFDVDGNYDLNNDKSGVIPVSEGIPESQSARNYKNKYLGLANDKVNVNSPKRLFNSYQLKTMLKDEKIYIVEGEFDAIALEMLGKNAIAIPGVGNMPNKEKFAQLFNKDVVICVDKDSAGNELLLRLTEMFHSENKSIKVKELNYKDVNDMVAA